MTELERASIDFYKAIMKTGRDILGHDEFAFKVETTIGTKAEDAERAQILGARIQDALKEGQEVIVGPYSAVSKLLKDNDKVIKVDKKDLFTKEKEK